jgi:general secretion pathway protein D
MKTITTLMLIAGLAAGLRMMAADAPETPPSKSDVPPPGLTNTPAPGAEAPQPAVPADAEAAPALPATTNAPALPAAVADNTATNAPGLTELPDGMVALNFRNVPLEMVLSSLSDALGYTVVEEATVKGNVTLWNNKPVSKEDALVLLDKMLRKEGYSALHDEKSLTIVELPEAKHRGIPVKILTTKDEADVIPKTEKMVTQIIQIRYANALQMIKDLTPLKPSYVELTANESANSLVVTGTETDVRHLAEIVRALDTTISGISSIRVFVLRYADAKELASEVKELFPEQSNTGGRNGMNGGRGIMRMMFGQGGPGGMGGDPNAGTGVSEARNAASRVAAVADERVNALVVSAPTELIDTIEQLVKEIDTNAENITEVRVFRLNYADASETADLLISLFPDDSRDTSRSSVRFGGRGGRGGGFNPFGMGGGNAAGDTSTRAKQKGRVMAVADPRTQSVIVSAASDLMPQIDDMIKELDSSPRMKKKVFVMDLNNATVDELQPVLEDLFQSTSARSSRSSTYQNGVLQKRQQQNSQGQGSSSLGQSTGSGARGGGSFGQ